MLGKLKRSTTKLSFTSSEAGTVKLLITRSAAGRRVKGRCVASARANRRKPRCTRTITITSRTLKLAAGAGSVTLPRLPAGSYSVSLTATDAAGNEARAVRTTLVVKPAPGKKRG